MTSKLFFILFIFLLSGCVNTGKVAVIGKNGKILTGTYSASLAGGSFIVSNGKLTCSGSYNSLDVSENITMPVHCNDGKKGFVIVTRQANGTDGFGKVVLSDGTQADFVFGKAANAF